MVYSKCKYWKLAHYGMNCKNCMYPNKLYCKKKFYNAFNVNQIIEELEDRIDQLEEELSENIDNTREIMSEDHD